MTIPEAIIEVMKSENRGLTYREITDKILERGLYHFKSADPKNMVNNAIRRRCIDYDFPAAHPVKLFKVLSGKRGMTCYQLVQFEQQNHTIAEVKKETPVSEMLLVEKMQSFHKKHLADIENQLMEAIMQNSPAFFESLVVQLLLKLGYGYGNDAGKVVGKPHDGGIDGIINEDKLGLDKILVQAKRYKKGNNIGVKEVTHFNGSMTKYHKGVFITTSGFTPEAKEFIETGALAAGNSISLIDGPMLCELMVKNEVGVKPVEKFTVYEVDVDFFDI